MKLYDMISCNNESNKGWIFADISSFHLFVSSTNKIITSLDVRSPAFVEKLFIFIAHILCSLFITKFNSVMQFAVLIPNPGRFWRRKVHKQNKMSTLHCRESSPILNVTEAVSGGSSLGLMAKVGRTLFESTFAAQRNVI
jgi:hypothetical protein